MATLTNFHIRCRNRKRSRIPRSWCKTGASLKKVLISLDGASNDEQERSRSSKASGEPRLSRSAHRGFRAVGFELSESHEYKPYTRFVRKYHQPIYKFWAGVCWVDLNFTSFTYVTKSSMEEGHAATGTKRSVTGCMHGVFGQTD